MKNLSSLFGRRREQDQRKQAIVHIGSEKTGSTAIQNLLYKNERVLASKGFLFPSSTCGLISNHRLVLHVQRSPDPALLKLNARDVARQPCAQQRSLDFVQNHDRQIQRFQQSRSASTVIYSSEHFHSRVTDVTEVQTLHDFLYQRYDSVKIIVYLRRQDLLARSAYNTAVQGGRTTPFCLDALNTGGTYYDFLSLGQRWAAVFGDDNFIARVYDRKTLEGGDVVSDFAVVSGIARHVDITTLITERSNPGLSHFALEVLREYNRREQCGEGVVDGYTREQRGRLIEALHELPGSDHVVPMPARADAERVYARYREDNQQFGKRWLGDARFSEDFTAYPDTAIAAPGLEGAAAQTLDRILCDLSAPVVRRA